VDRNVCKDGSYRWISWVVIPLPDRGIVFGIGQDITERKLTDDNRRRAEETLLESERRLSTLMSNLPGMAYRCRNDPKWTMEFVSEGALQLTGYAVSDLIENKTVAFGDLIHADDRDVLWDQVQQAIAERRLFQLEYRIRTSAGEERWVWEQGCGIFSGDSELQSLEGFITDITEQKQAELDLRKAHAQLEQRVAERTAELQESNEELRLFKTFAEASGEGFGMSDMDRRIVYGNAALARLVGASKPEDAYGKHPSIYYSDDYPESLKTEIFPVLERSGSWQGELTMVSVTGERIPVLQTSFTLVDQDGEAVRRGVVITDLRKIKEAEESLQNSLRELQAIYDGMLDGLVLVDLVTLRFLRANPAFCQMLGYSQDELLSMTVNEVHPPESLPRVDEAVLTLAEGNPILASDMPVLRKNGSIFQADVSVSAISVGGMQYAISFFRDITQRLKDEERLRSSEARYRALVESSPDAVVMCDLEGRITFASPQAAKRHGVKDASDLIGQTAMDLVVEQDREPMQLNIRRLFECGLRRNDQYTGLRMDGTTFFGELSASVIKGISGEAESFMAVYRDITERKEAQDALQKEQDALRRILQAGDRDRELITYEIHDGVAQQLLGALMHFEAVSQLDSGVAKKARSSFGAGLTALREASAEARSLMNRTRTPVLERFGVRMAIADFIDQFSERPNAQEITYRCEAQFGRLEPVLENTIFRVAQEAITNACIHSKSEMIRVSLIQQDEDVTVEVQDNGIGFDTANVKEGRFGLNGIRERTRLVGKDLQIESTPGMGTQIRATFPLIYRDVQAEGR
jgi:PAS domain S-box-containing protein